VSGPARESWQVNAWLGPLAVLTCVTLVLTALRPGLAVSLVIFAASAAFGAYRLAANTAFVLRVPNERRAQAFGIASTALIVAREPYSWRPARPRTW
jgi:hypothetical protein